MEIRSTSREVAYAAVSPTSQRATASRVESAGSSAESTGAAAAAAAAAPVGNTVASPVYFSPVFRYDTAARVGVLAFLDDTTGEVKEQVPAERVIEQYRRLSFRRAAGIRDSELPPELPPTVDIQQAAGEASGDTGPTGGSDTSTGGDPRGGQGSAGLGTPTGAGAAGLSGTTVTPTVGASASPVSVAAAVGVYGASAGASVAAVSTAGYGNSAGGGRLSITV